MLWENNNLLQVLGGISRLYVCLFTSGSTFYLTVKKCIESCVRKVWIIILCYMEEIFQHIWRFANSIFILSLLVSKLIAGSGLCNRERESHFTATEKRNLQRPVSRYRVICMSAKDQSVEPRCQKTTRVPFRCFLVKFNNKNKSNKKNLNVRLKKREIWKWDRNARRTVPLGKTC